MELVRGQIVTSRRGRDVTKTYVVLALAANGDRVLVCDGEKRTLAAPKGKNPRHIQPTNTILPPGEMETDLTIKRALADYQNRRTHDKQGG